MQRLSCTLATLVVAITFSTESRAETSCDLARVAPDKVVTVRGKIKSIDVDRGDRSFWIVVELSDRCGTAEVKVSMKQRPRCRIGTIAAVTGPYKGETERLIEAQRMACVGASR
jgi:hypothetical protein